MLTKSQLSKALASLEGYPDPKPQLEQYVTPPQIASELLWWINLRGELRGRIFDLGTGVGTLAIGAKLLNPQADVYGFDLDLEALKVASKNASKLGVQVNWICLDVLDLSGTADLVIMNPPFGAQHAQRGMDLAFLRKALSISKLVYSIHRAGSSEFISAQIAPAKITHRYSVQIPIKACFDFHRKPVALISAEVYRIEI